VLVLSRSSGSTSSPTAISRALLDLGDGTDASRPLSCDHLPMRPSVLIVDDHAAFRAAARELLEADGFRVVGEAADGAAALTAIAELEPDVVLLDVQLPDLNGFDVADRLAGGPAVVFVSSRSVSSFRWRLAANPAWTFIAKSDLSGEALAAALG
jgi:two-component system nitrate/nitrite response regulator NarL